MREQAVAGSAIELIAAERKRQVEVESWTHAHDDGHTSGVLAIAAACYSLPEGLRLYEGRPMRGVHMRLDLVEVLWPWWHQPSRGRPHPEWWKPTPNDRIRELVKAGALIVAEIERLQRLEAG